MIKRLISLAFIGTIGLLVYLSFFGTPDDKENVRLFTSQLKNAGQSLGKILQKEKDKFDAGEYSQALEQISDVFQKLSDQAKSMDGDYSERLAELDKQRKALESKLNTVSNGRMTQDAKEALEREVPAEYENLIRDIEKLVDEVERDNK